MYEIHYYYYETRDSIRLLSDTLSNRQEITITGIGNGHDARQLVSEIGYTGRCPERGSSPNSEKLSGRGSQSHVRPSKMVNGGLGQHSVVLQLRLPQWGAVPSDQHQLGYGLRLVSSRDLLSLTLQSL